MLHILSKVIELIESTKLTMVQENQYFCVKDFFFQDLFFTLWVAVHSSTWAADTFIFLITLIQLWILQICWIRNCKYLPNPSDLIRKEAESPNQVYYYKQSIFLTLVKRNK